jgi:hypothetical protein
MSQYYQSTLIAALKIVPTAKPRRPPKPFRFVEIKNVKLGVENFDFRYRATSTYITIFLPSIFVTTSTAAGTV